MATLQVRNVPEDLHRRLKARAAESGRTLSEYVLEELRDLSHRPTMREWLAEVSGLEASELSMSSAEAIHAERGQVA